jgi:transcriptional regulator with XRE-family HTH domain
MESNAKIGANIKKLRELRNLTQEHMADKLDMSQTGYGNIERDVTDISMSRLQQIAKVLEVTVQDLLGFDANKMIFNQTAHDSPYSNVGCQYNQGIADSERKQYEARITDLQKENDRLHNLLEKTFSK